MRRPADRASAGYLRGFADAQTRRELKPMVSQLFADQPGHPPGRRRLLAYNRLDGVDEALHTLLGPLLDGDAKRGDSTSAVEAATRSRSGPPRRQ